MPKPFRLSGARHDGLAPAGELAELRAAVAALEAQIKVLPEQLAALAKAAEPQRKRLEALAAAQERLQAQVRELADRVGELGERQPARRLASALARLRTRLGRLPAAAPPAAPASPPADGMLAGGRAAPGTRAVLAVVLGLPPAEQEEIVARLLANPPVAGPPVQPVFLTDGTDFGPFRRHRALFELLPREPPERPDRPARDWALYRARRFALLCAKWEPIRVVAFGPAAARQLAAWRASPHIGDSVKALLPVAAGAPG